MMLIPQREKTLLRIYRCPVCHRIYGEQPGDAQYNCTVLHVPGSCCHCWEPEIKTVGDLEKVVAPVATMLQEAVMREKYEEEA